MGTLSKISRGERVMAHLFDGAAPPSREAARQPKRRERCLGIARNSDELRVIRSFKVDVYQLVQQFGRVLDAPHPDGRRTRYAARRGEILDAAADYVLANGLTGLAIRPL